MRIISGIYRQKLLKSPKDNKTRPTQNRLRETLFDICHNNINNAVFLDIFAGTGAMGFEALSRGASRVVFIDNHRPAIECIQYNIRTLGVENCADVFNSDAMSILTKFAAMGKRFDIVFIDPPYNATTMHNRNQEYYDDLVLEFFDENPILNPSGMLFIESPRALARPLKTLTLKSSRPIGKTMLRQYVS